MTPRQAFKAACLRQLAAAGHSPEKAAGILDVLGAPGEVLKSVVNAGGMAVGAVAPLAATAAGVTAIGAPVVAGVGAGYGLSRLRDDDTDVDAAKADELIDTYRQLAEEARRRARAKGLRGRP